MKRIWITGGGSGIGAALAKQFASEGHRVFISGRDEKKLEAVGHSTTPVVCDICEEQQVEAALDAIGHIDLAILNAGTYEPGAALETTAESFRRSMEVNYFGTLNCLRNVIPRMRETGGHIAVVASLAGYRGLPKSSGYGPSKAAVISLCESLKTELEGSPIKFQLINPGFVKSPLTSKNPFKMPFLMEPDDAAAAIIKGLEGNHFEIAFPAPFVRRMKLLRLLPYNLFFPLIRKATSS